MSRYALKLESGQPSGGFIPGELVLCLPDEEHSQVAGTFPAKLGR
jgi:hypothetical protein